MDSGSKDRQRGGGDLANRFLAAFNTIDQELAELVGGEFKQTFKRQVAVASRRNLYVKKYAEDLLQYADLRNAIVHTRRANAVIAEPHEDVVLHIEQISKQLIHPPIVADVMTLQPKSVTRGASVGEVLQMFRKHNISRCPIVSNKGVEGLITAKCVVKWLEEVAEKSSTQQGGEKVSVEAAMSVSVGELLRYGNDNEYGIIRRTASVEEAIDQFQQGVPEGRYVQALLVTVDGTKGSPLVGIVTPSDLPRFFEAGVNID